MKKADPLGALIDELERRRRARLDAEAEVARRREAEDAQKRLVLDALAAANLDGARGRLAQVTRKLVPLPVVTDWESLYAYVKRRNAFDLLHRRLTTTAVLERWEAGETVPGVDREQRLTLHVSALRRES